MNKEKRASDKDLDVHYACGHDNGYYKGYRQGFWHGFLVTAAIAWILAVIAILR